MTEEGYAHEPDERERDGPGAATQWGVVGLVAACVVGAPLLILFYPPTFLPYEDAYMGLSLVPGLVLGVLGVWSAYAAATR